MVFSIHQQRTHDIVHLLHYRICAELFRKMFSSGETFYSYSSSVCYWRCRKKVQASKLSDLTLGFGSQTTRLANQGINTIDCNFRAGENNNERDRSSMNFLHNNFFCH